MSTKTLQNFLDILTDSAGISDPRMNRFLIKSPLQLITILVLYLSVVYKFGPQFMRHRKPYSLRGLMVAYNVFQIIVNATLFVKTLPVLSTMTSICTPPDTNKDVNSFQLQMHHYFILLKYFDLVETAFYVLRKKERQISFLHVYHHVGILVTAWIPGKYFPGGQLIFVGLFNALAHSIMYCYYLITMFNDGAVWWKKYVTALQIAQQVLIFLSVLPTVLDATCLYPVGFMAGFALNILVIIYLFGKFYINTYVKKVK